MQKNLFKFTPSLPVLRVAEFKNETYGNFLFSSILVPPPTISNTLRTNSHVTLEKLDALCSVSQQHVASRGVTRRFHSKRILVRSYENLYLRIITVQPLVF